jgi:hypothetical protein
MGEKRNVYRLLYESQRERDHWEYQDIGGYITVRWTF